MDLSKLPKLSQTPQQTDETPAGADPASPTPAPAPVPAATEYCRACGLPLRVGARFCDACGAPTLRSTAGRLQVGAEAWISIAIGVILLFLFPHLLEYLLHPGTTAFDATDSQTGATIPYMHSAFIWPDIGVTFFCLLLIVDPLLMLLVPKRPVVMAALVFSALCAVLNLWVVVRSMNIIGFQIVCAVAVAFSIYVAIQRWSMLRQPLA